MRAIQSRKLKALGYFVGSKLRFRGLEANCLVNQAGDSHIIVSNVLFGPSWAQIYKSLQNQDSSPTLLTIARNPSILIQDTPSARDLIEGLYKSSNDSRRKQVHLDGVGFVEIENRAKLDFRVTLAPTFSVLFVLGLGVFLSTNSKNSEDLPVILSGEKCIVDSGELEFNNWLKNTFATVSEFSLGQNFQLSTPEGDLNIVVENTIGSAAKVTGSVVCADGKQRIVNHRIDTSGLGNVLELGQ